MSDKTPSQKLRAAIWGYYQNDLTIQQTYPDFEIFYEKVMKGLTITVKEQILWLGFGNKTLTK